MTESFLKLLKLYFKMILVKILIMYPPCFRIEEYHPWGRRLNPVSLCLRLFGMENRSQTGSSLVLGYLQRLIDSGISSTNLLQGSNYVL